MGERLKTNDKLLIDFIIKNSSKIIKNGDSEYSLFDDEYKILIKKNTGSFFSISVYKVEWTHLFSIYYYSSDDYMFNEFKSVLEPMKSDYELKKENNIHDFINFIKL